MKRERVLTLFIFGVIFLGLLACGMKGPPFLPERSMPFKVKQMTGEWKDEVVYLKGRVTPRNDDDGNAPDAIVQSAFIEMPVSTVVRRDPEITLTPPKEA